MDTSRQDKGRMRTVGWSLTGLVSVFLLFDAAIHLLKESHAVAASLDLGWPVNQLVTIGAIELACLILYLIPRTSTLGAVLLTGYLGGAVATNLRVAKPLFGTVLFPVYVGLMVWGGLWLRNLGVRAVIPLQQTS